VSKVFSEKKFYIAGVLLSLVLAGVVSFYASSSPDGLEKVAGDIGFLQTAKETPVSGSPLADYGVEGIENERASVGLAGVIGAGATGIVAMGLFIYLSKRKKP